MECYVGLMSELKESFTERVLNAISECDDNDNGISGAADIETQQAWVFIDNIAKRGDVFEWVMKSIVSTTVHELVHLCGYDDEAVARRAEELLVWECWSWCYRPLPPYQGK